MDKTRVKYGYRFRYLSQSQTELTDDLNINYTIKEQFDGNGYCLTVPLTEDIELKKLEKIISQINAKKENQEIFMSIVPRSDCEVLGVPNYILDILHATKTNFNVSYTFVL